MFRCGISGTAHDGFSKRLAWFNDSDTALQSVADVKGNEHAVALREDPFARDHVRKLAVGNGFENGYPGQLKGGSPGGFRAGRHAWTSCGLQACGAGGVA